MSNSFHTACFWSYVFVDESWFDSACLVIVVTTRIRVVICYWMFQVQGFSEVVHVAFLAFEEAEIYNFALLIAAGNVFILFT